VAIKILAKIIFLNGTDAQSKGLKQLVVANKSVLSYNRFSVGKKFTSPNIIILGE
jgi:hypothetical protein